MNPPAEESLPSVVFDMFMHGLMAVWLTLSNERFRDEFFHAIDPVLARSARDIDGPWKSEICFQAARFGHSKILEWCLFEKFPLDVNCLKIAMTNGHVSVLNMIQWHALWPKDMCAVAAMSGNLRILQWCRNEGCPWDERTCHGAAMMGHLKIMKWCRENGCPWDKKTCAVAAEYCQIHVYKWCLENGCPCDTGVTTSLDGNIGHLVRVNPEHITKLRLPADEEDEDEDEFYSDHENVSDDDEGGSPN